MKIILKELKKSKTDKLIIDTVNRDTIYNPNLRFKIISKYISLNYINHTDINDFKI